MDNGEGRNLAPGSITHKWPNHRSTAATSVLYHFTEYCRDVTFPMKFWINYTQNHYLTTKILDQRNFGYFSKSMFQKYKIEIEMFVKIQCVLLIRWRAPKLGSN